MLSTKHATLIRNVLGLILVGALAFGAFNIVLPTSEFVEDCLV